MNELILITKDELRQIIREEVSELSQGISGGRKRLLFEEAAEYLNMPVPTLRIHRHKIGGAKMGKRWTFTQEELDRFIESNQR